MTNFTGIQSQDTTVVSSVQRNIENISSLYLIFESITIPQFSETYRKSLSASATSHILIPSQQLHANVAHISSISSLFWHPQHSVHIAGFRRKRV
jgi:hypothetical protein